MIALWGAVYKSDDVSLVEDDQSLPLFLEVRDGVFSFIIEDSSNLSINENINKVFYLKLPDLQGVPERDIDTIRFEYQIYFDESKCPKQDYQSFKAYYNDSLQYDGTYVSYLELKKI